MLLRSSDCHPQCDVLGDAKSRNPERNGAAVTVSVTTAPPSARSLPTQTRRFLDLGAHPFRTTRLFFFLSIFGLVAASRKAWRRIPPALSMVLLLVLLVTGCAGGKTPAAGSTGTPARRYQLLVTACSAGVTRTIALSLTVQ